MARSNPTEADLGIEPTDAELTSAPVVAEAPVSNDDADISLSDDQPVLTAPDAGKPDDADKPADDADAAGKPEKTVDLRALQEARASERELKQRNALLEQRVNAILAQLQPTAQPATAATQTQGPAADEVPGEDDVVGRINWLVAQMQKQGEQQTQERTATAEERQRSELQGKIAAVEQQFRATTPDYDAAITFVAESRDRELQMLYPYSTAEQRSAYIRNEWSNIAQGSMQAGLNVAEQVYNLAKARGFSGAAPQAPAAAAPKPVDPVALASAQQRHQSLSDAGGGESVAPIDAKALATMDDKAFNAWLSQKGNDKKLEAILGA